jgi:hypothetical protein
VWTFLAGCGNSYESFICNSPIADNTIYVFLHSVVVSDSLFHLSFMSLSPVKQGK